jgi:hypothetical protein
MAPKVAPAMGRCHSTAPVAASSAKVVDWWLGSAGFASAAVFIVLDAT